MAFINITHTHLLTRVLLYFIPEPKTQIVGEPDIFVDIGSMLNLSCVVSYTERPPVHVSWLHNGIEVSFRGPRNGVSVSIAHNKRRRGKIRILSQKHYVLKIFCKNSCKKCLKISQEMSIHPVRLLNTVCLLNLDFFPHFF